jgi:hypothetical protein
MRNRTIFDPFQEQVTNDEYEEFLRESAERRRIDREQARLRALVGFEDDGYYPELFRGANGGCP